MTTYPCISLWQPYASALFMYPSSGRVKGHETRHWAPPARLIGRRVAIHAAKRRVAADDLYPATEQAMRTIVGEDWRRRLPYGAVVGTAVLESIHWVEHDDMHVRVDQGAGSPVTELDFWFGDWSKGRCVWFMADPELLPAPLAVTGRQGWFTVDLP